MVLLIFAGVSINLILGDNGIVKKAQEARKKQKKQKQMKKKILLDGPTALIKY